MEFEFKTTLSQPGIPDEKPHKRDIPEIPDPTTQPQRLPTYPEPVRTPRVPVPVR